MYRTRQIRIRKGHKLRTYCSDLVVKSARLYNRANFTLRQYATAYKAFEKQQPLYANQLQVWQLVREVLDSTKYMPQGAWLSYGSLDCFLKATKDPAYYALPSQANQQILKVLLRDYKSFFEALKVYQTSPERFTGRPKLPHYSDGQKTAILTNQICSIKESKYLKFPGTKHRLNLGIIPADATLKEVHIKPCANDFVIDVVLSVPDEGIMSSPANDSALLKELAKLTDLDDLRVLAIDPGTENLAAVVNNFGDTPMLFKGSHVKSVNQWYNKELSRLTSAAMLCNGRHMTRQIRTITAKRNRIIKDFFHKTSRTIADYAKANHVDVVILGHNVAQKQEIHIGHVNNQNFVQIPFSVFAGMLRYKLNAYGITFVCVEESYTSKSNFLAMDPLPVYGKEESTPEFSGRRVHRGLYRHYDGTISNADINGAANILRKVFPKVSRWDRGIVNMPCSVVYFNASGSCRSAA